VEGPTLTQDARETSSARGFGGPIAKRPCTAELEANTSGRPFRLPRPAARGHPERQLTRRAVTCSRARFFPEYERLLQENTSIATGPPPIALTTTVVAKGDDAG
jgi:hypothetical protein